MAGESLLIALVPRLSSLQQAATHACRSGVKLQLKLAKRAVCSAGLPITFVPALHDD